MEELEKRHLVAFRESLDIQLKISELNVIIKVFGGFSDNHPTTEIEERKQCLFDELNSRIPKELLYEFLIKKHEKLKHDELVFLIRSIPETTKTNINTDKLILDLIDVLLTKSPDSLDLLHEYQYSLREYSDVTENSLVKERCRVFFGVVDAFSRSKKVRGEGKLSIFIP